MQYSYEAPIDSILEQRGRSPNGDIQTGEAQVVLHGLPAGASTVRILNVQEGVYNSDRNSDGNSASWVGDSH